MSEHGAGPCWSSPRNTAQAGFVELLTLIKYEEAAEEEEDALLQAGLEGHFT